MTAKKTSAKKASAKKASAKKASAKKASAKKASAKKASAKKASAKKASAKKARKLEVVDERDLAKSLSDHQVDLAYEWDDDDTDMRYGAWDNSYRGSHGKAFVPSLTSFSDYSGSDVERSNFRVFSEQFNDLHGKVWQVAVGGYGTNAIVIKADRVTPEINDFFGALDDYPVADEGDLSELGNELQNEAWEGWARKDFVDGLNKAYAEWVNVDLNEPDFGEWGSDWIFELFHRMAETANEYWEIEQGGNAYINVSRVIENGLDRYDDEILSKLQRSGFVWVRDTGDLDVYAYGHAAKAAVRLGQMVKRSERTTPMPWGEELSERDAFASAVAANKDFDEDVMLIADPGLDPDVLDSLFDFFMVGYENRG